MAMKKEKKENQGIQRLIQKCKMAFRIPENTNYYSEEDLKTAERKFIKIARMKGTVHISDIPSQDQPSSHTGTRT